MVHGFETTLGRPLPTQQSLGDELIPHELEKVAPQSHKKGEPYLSERVLTATTKQAQTKKNEVTWLPSSSSWSPAW